MISPHLRLLPVLFLSLTLNGCESKKNPEPEAVAVPIPESAPQPAKQEDSPSLITSGTWCRGDDWEKFQTIMRVRLTKQKIQYEYLKVENANPLTVFRFQEAPVWMEKPSPIATPDLGTYQVVLVQNEAAIPQISGFEKQKKLVEDLLVKNSQLKAPPVPFAPKIALQILSRSYESGEVVERNLYPCELYSQTLLGDATVRPLIELNLLMGELQGNYTPEGETELAQKMALTYPVEDTMMDLSNLPGSQWCSWRQVSENQLTLQTVTFGQGKFVENKHTEVFAVLESEEERSQSLTSNADRSEPFEMNVAGSLIQGRNLSDKEHPNHPARETFSFIRDAAGATVLLRRDQNLPEWGRPVFEDRYYDCARTEPMAFSPVFGSYLRAILDLQLKRVQ